ncbi:MAG: phosphatase PAP2 family protein [bacterium]|nr:phosphatase PAP2 family protein [bacterium]
MNINRIIFLVFILLVSFPVFGAEDLPEEKTEPKGFVDNTGAPFRTNEYRYENCNIFIRAFASLASTFVGVGGWEQEDWIIAGSVTAATSSLMLPFNPSVDVRLDQYVKNNKNHDYDILFPNITSGQWGYIIGGMAAIGYGSGYLFGNNTILEYISLTMEAIGITQVYHISFKLLMGREGPPNGEGQGVIRGPKYGVQYFPYGTPSGHIATLYAITTVTAEYFDSLALRIISHAVNLYYTANLVYNNEHFISDMIWGAPIGYFVGMWVVKHRSSNFTYISEGENAEDPDEAKEAKVVVYPGVDYNTGNITLNAALRF